MTDPAGSPLSIGTRREPFFDRRLIEKLRHVSHELVDSVRTECEFPFDQPWEGPYSCYPAIINDGGLYRMYYRGQSAIKAPSFTCYAESRDGKNWVRPKLGLHSFAGRNDNNILLVEENSNEKTTHNFTPFLDLNPAADPQEKYKAVAGDDKHGLFGYASADGIHWRRIQPTAVFRDGVFDSQNIPFWSEAEHCYVLYFRVWTEGLYQGKRTIARTASADFRNWTKPEQMTFGDVPLEELYTNVTMPCPGAPHLYVALPSRFVMKRQWMSSELARSLTVQEGREADVSDTVFMTSRGGTVYERHFPEAYLKPGLDPQDWVGRNNMVTTGLVELDEGATWGLYRSRHYASDSSRLTLHTLRRDGFARLRAGRKAGRVLTKSFVAAGNHLCLNFATSGAGTLLIDVLDAEERPIVGFSGRAAARLFGDSTHHVVPWSRQHRWSDLHGRAIRLRFTLTEAELYALQQIQI